MHIYVVTPQALFSEELNSNLFIFIICVMNNRIELTMLRLQADLVRFLANDFEIYIAVK